MIEVRLIGGLGNQLFQLGAAAVLSKRFGLAIRLWPGAMQKYATPRHLELPRFIDFTKLNAHVCGRPHFILRARLAKIFPGVWCRTACVSDSNILAVAGESMRLHRVYLDGYFIESIDQGFFEEAVGLLHAGIQNGLPNTQPSNVVCAVHVRGGDFVKLGWILDDAIAYYRASLIRVLDRAPSAQIIAVTDDPNYTSELMSNLRVNAEIISGDILSDFNIIRTATFAILSNSTFSFWAGALRTGNNSWSTLAPNVWRPGKFRTIRLKSEADY